MGLPDTLKKLGLGDLLNILKINVDNSKNFHFKDTTININITGRDQIEYTPPNTVEYELVRNIHEKLYKKGVSGFVRKDLVMPRIGMMATRAKNKEIFKKYKERIDEKYYRAMIASYTIINFENNGDYTTSNELFTDMVRKFPIFGRHIYNFCRSGLMEGFFWNKLGDIIYQGAEEDIIRENFKKIFEDYVDFYPHAIWVNPIMSFQDIINEIAIRFNINEIIWLDIYFRGKDKEELADCIIEFIENHEGIHLDSNETYTICNSFCRKLGIRKDFNKFQNI